MSGAEIGWTLFGIALVGVVGVFALAICSGGKKADKAFGYDDHPEGLPHRARRSGW